MRTPVGHKVIHSGSNRHDGVYTNDMVVTTYLDDMIGGAMTNLAALRRGFAVSDPTKFDSLDLYIDYDDGFVAYINGREVALTITDPDSDPTTGIPFDTIGNDVNADHESTNGWVPRALDSQSTWLVSQFADGGQQ